MTGFAALKVNPIESTSRVISLSTPEQRIMWSLITAATGLFYCGQAAWVKGGENAKTNNVTSYIMGIFQATNSLFLRRVKSDRVFIVCNNRRKTYDVVVNLQMLKCCGPGIGRETTAPMCDASCNEDQDHSRRMRVGCGAMALFYIPGSLEFNIRTLEGRDS
jgi:hypothetical protein